MSRITIKHLVAVAQCLYPVIASAALEQCVASFGKDVVLAAHTTKDIVARAAEKPVIPVAAEQCVSTVLARKCFAAQTTIGLIKPGAAPKPVITHDTAQPDRGKDIRCSGCGNPIKVFGVSITSRRLLTPQGEARCTPATSRGITSVKL